MMFKITLFAALVSAVVAQTNLPACGPTTGKLEIAGSSTVFPIVNLWKQQYDKNCPAGLNITAESLGSGVGAGRVCGQTSRGTPVDIGTLSRRFNPTEASPKDATNTTFQCIVGGGTRSTIQVEVALDGITFALVSGGLAAQCLRKTPGLTLGQLRWLFSNYSEALMTANGGWSASEIPNPDSNTAIRSWRELDKSCPDAEVQTAGPGPASGTNDLVREAIFKPATGPGAVSEGFRSKYFSSEIDEELVNFVETSSTDVYGDCIAFFGFSFYLEEGQLLYGVPIKNNAGVFTEPTAANILSNAYTPLSRSLYLQVLDTPESKAKSLPFIEYGLSNTGTVDVAKTGYVTLTLAQRTEQLTRLGLPAPDDTAPVVVVPPTPGSPNFADDEFNVDPPNCGIFGLNLFCTTGCGFFGRLLGLCEFTR